jgi:hypothetical protein
VGVRDLMRREQQERNFQQLKAVAAVEQEETESLKQQ